MLDLATRPTLAKWAAEVEKLDLRTSGVSAADIVAEERRRDDPPRRGRERGVDAIVGGPDRQALREAIARARLIHVPEHFHVEVVSAIRGLHRRQEVDAALAGTARADGRLVDLR